MLSELTEAFIKKSHGLLGEEIDWIHPSCRDLAIDELLENSSDRQRFLAGCSESGLALATSLAGGANGLRRLPLLQTDSDWRCFGARMEQLVEERPSVIRAVWDNYQALSKQAAQDVSLHGDLERLKEIFKSHVCPVASRRLGQIGYDDSQTLRIFFQMCRELQIACDIDLTEAWAECLEDVKNWNDDPEVIWEDDGMPGRVEAFLKALYLYNLSFLEQRAINQQLQAIHVAILKRVTEEKRNSFESPKDDDDAAQRASGYDTMHRCFERLADVPVWTEEQNKSLKQCAFYFRAQAESLSEGLPSEPDVEGSGQESSSSEDVNIYDLFSDL